MKEAENNNEDVDFMPNAKSSSIFLGKLAPSSSP